MLKKFSPCEPCCSGPCQKCEDGGPHDWYLTVSGIVDNPSRPAHQQCSNCAEFNGIFILRPTNYVSMGCKWIYFYPDWDYVDGWGAGVWPAYGTGPCGRPRNAFGGYLNAYHNYNTWTAELSATWHDNYDGSWTNRGYVNIYSGWGGYDSRFQVSPQIPEDTDSSVPRPNCKRTLTDSGQEGSYDFCDAVNFSATIKPLGSGRKNLFTPPGYNGTPPAFDCQFSLTSTNKWKCDVCEWVCPIVSTDPPRRNCDGAGVAILKEEKLFCQQIKVRDGWMCPKCGFRSSVPVTQRECGGQYGPRPRPRPKQKPCNCGHHNP